MLKYVIFIGIAIGAITILKLNTTESTEQKDQKNKIQYKYNRKSFLMTRPEHEFFDILVEIVASRYYVFPQIHLSSILDNKVVGQNWKAAFSGINQKSVDYLICDKAYIRPLIAIELDDKSHTAEDRKERDGNVELMLKKAQLPLLRFGNNGSFNKDEIQHLVMKHLGGNN